MYTNINSRFVKIILYHHFNFNKKEENIEKMFRIKFGKEVTNHFFCGKNFDNSQNENS